MKKKVLNLFGGIGGNRRAFDDDKYDVTTVESNQNIAAYYLSEYPQDEVIVGDAYDYLWKNFHKFDFVWASPPCTTHTILNKVRAGRKYKKTFKNDIIKLPDPGIFSLIIWMKEIYRGDWVVENVKNGYSFKYFNVKPTAVVGRHYIWSNFHVTEMDVFKKEHVGSIEDICKIKNINYEKFKKWNFNLRKDNIGHNTVLEKYARHVMDCYESNNVVGDLFEY